MGTVVIPFVNPLPACPKCGSSSVSASYTSPGSAWDGAPELLVLSCSTCGYGAAATKYTFVMNTKQG